MPCGVDTCKELGPRAVAVEGSLNKNSFGQVGHQRAYGRLSRFLNRSMMEFWREERT